VAPGIINGTRYAAVNNNDTSLLQSYCQIGSIPDPNDPTYIKAENTIQLIITIHVTKVMAIHYVIMSAIITELKTLILLMLDLAVEHYHLHCIHLVVVLLASQLTSVLDKFKDIVIHTKVIFQMQVKSGIKDTLQPIFMEIT
jgi:hypothetical protein